MEYLRKAFSGFVRAKHGSEMVTLGRVICEILHLDRQEQDTVMEAITRLAPAGGVGTSPALALGAMSTSLFSTIFESPQRGSRR